MDVDTFPAQPIGIFNGYTSDKRSTLILDQDGHYIVDYDIHSDDGTKLFTVKGRVEAIGQKKGTLMPSPQSINRADRAQR